MGKEYKIIHHIGDLCKENNGWKKELNIVAMNDREPFFEIRSWNKNHSEMGKGVTLTLNEMRKLKCILEQMDLRMMDTSFEYKEEEKE